MYIHRYKRERERERESERASERKNTAHDRSYLGSGCPWGCYSPLERSWEALAPEDCPKPEP